MPFDRAEAFLKKLDLLSRADKDDFVANYKADPIQWQVKESGWLAHPVRLPEDPRGECSLDSFKDFFQSILDHYCSHYQTSQFSELFQKKLETIQALKQSLLEKAARVNSEQEEGKALRAKMLAKLAEVQSNEEKIKE